MRASLELDVAGGYGREGAFDPVGEFLADVGGVRWAGVVVGVERSEGVGHDDDDGEVGG